MTAWHRHTISRRPSQRARHAAKSVAAMVGVVPGLFDVTVDRAQLRQRQGAIGRDARIGWRPAVVIK